MKIVIAEPEGFSEVALEQLEPLGDIVRGPFSRSQLKRAIKDAHILILRLQHLADKNLLASSKLEFILTPTTGLNHIDLRTAKEKNIHVISLQGEVDFLETIPSTAELTWGLLLAIIRKIPAAQKDVLQGNWDRDKFKSRNLNALTLGILGYGRVGKQIARFAEAFNMDYYYHDIDEKYLGGSRAVADLFEFLGKIDVLTIHLPLNDETNYFLNDEKIRHLRKGAYIVNTARGELIDEVALVTALQESRISGIATDVLNQELIDSKRSNSPLLAHARSSENCIITPHIAGATIDSMKMTEEFVVGKLIARIKERNKDR